MLCISTFHILAIEEELDGGEVCSGSGDLARIGLINVITSNCKPDTLSFRLEWAFLSNNAQLSGLATMGLG